MKQSRALAASVFAVLLSWPQTVCAAESPLPIASPTPTATPDAAAEERDDSALADPLTPNLWYSLEDESMQSVSGPSNQLNLRAQLPLGATPPLTNLLASGRALSLIKLKLPIVLSAPSNTDVEAATGTGDLTVAWLGGFGTPQSRWAGGAAFKFPTGKGSLGSGKWSAGPAIGYTYASGQWTLGVYSQSFFSYAGSSTRSPVAQTDLQPAISCALPNGWSIGNSQMKYTYDYDAGRFTSLPVGIRIAKRIESGPRRLNLYFEAERNLSTSGGTTWSLRLGAKLVFLRS